MLMTIAIICSVISSTTILFMIFVKMAEEFNKILSYAIPLMFWMGLFGEQCCIWIANMIRHKKEKNGEGRKIKGRCGVLSVRMTDGGYISDLIFLISIIAYVLCAAMQVGENSFQYFLIFLVILSFRLRCILNGKNFRYKISIQKEKNYAKKFENECK